MLFSIKTFRKYAWELSFKLPFTPFTQVLNKVCVFKPFVHLFSSNATVNDLVQILPTIVIFSKIVLQPLKFIHLSTIDTRLIFLKFRIYHITSLLKNSPVGHNFIQYKTQNYEYIVLSMMWVFQVPRTFLALPQSSPIQWNKNIYSSSGHHNYGWGTFFGLFLISKQTLFTSSVTLSCPTSCNPRDCTTPGFPVHHQLPGPSQSHVHRVGNAIQLSHPLLTPSPPAFNISLHHGLF